MPVKTYKFKDMKSLHKALYKKKDVNKPKKTQDQEDSKKSRDLDHTMADMWAKRRNEFSEEVGIANAAGNGGIDGIGIGNKGEPGVTKKPKILRRTKFAGNVVFEVDNTTYHNATWGKKKFKHWKSYVKNEDVLEEIREYAYANPNKPIIVQNEMTGAMQFIRYGGKRY